MRAVLAALMLLAFAPAAEARPVVVEMFTSLACSSCPPADAVLAGLAKNPGVLALSFNVTYWNSAAWSDPYGLKTSTDRQAWYAGLDNSQDVYTPEAVVDGTTRLVGSDAAKLNAAIATAKAAPAGDTPITITGGNMITITVSAGPSGAGLWLFGYDSEHSTAIGGGENGGATLTEANIVRSITSLGTSTGPEISMTMPRPAGGHVAVLLQTATGAVIGAASE
jgi:hypothetical protein